MLATSLALFLLVASPESPADGVSKLDSDTDRVPLHTVIPDYPRTARRDRIEGEVQVCFNITRGGHPSRIAVRHSTHRIFEKPARKAVRKSTWLPLGKDEPMSGIKACRTFRFNLVPVSNGERDQEYGSLPVPGTPRS